MFASTPRHVKRGAAITALTLSLALVATACTSSAPLAEEPAKPAITFVAPIAGSAYFTAARTGGVEAAGQFGATVTEAVPEENAPDSQAPIIEDVVAQGADAIVLAPHDPTADGSALDAAREAGVKVVTFDTDTATEHRDLFIRHAGAEAIARIQVQLIAEQTGGTGDIAILSSSADAADEASWIELILAGLAADHPGIDVVEVAYAGDDSASFDAAAALLETHPELAGIVSTSTDVTAGAARFVQSDGLQGTVAVTGLGLPSQLQDFVADGTVAAFALWNPIDVGYLAAAAAHALIAGDITGAEGDTFDAGRLGTYTVGADSTVLLGDPQIFTAENIGRFEF